MTSVCSSTLTQGTASQLFVLQVLNIFNGNIQIENEIKKKCLEISDIVNNNTLSIQELRLENSRLKAEIISRDQNIEELKTISKTLNPYEEHLKDEILHIRNDYILNPDWRYEHYMNRKDTLDARVQTNNEQFLKTLQSIIKSLVNVPAIVNNSTVDLELNKRLKFAMDEPMKFIQNLQPVMNEYQTIYSIMFSEIENANKVSESFRYHYDRLKVILASDQYPNQKNVQELSSKLELNICQRSLKESSKRISEIKCERSHNALSELSYSYYKYDNFSLGFERAVKTCDLRDIKLLPEIGVPTQFKSGNTMAHMAIEEGCLGALDWLTSNDSTIIDKRNHLGQTPLHLSVQHKNHLMVEILLAKGANVNAISKYQGTPLHIAAQVGDKQLAQALLNKNATVDSTTQEQFTPLHVAAENGHNEVAHLLINKSAQVDARTNEDLTPLHLSAKHGHLDTVHVLLMSGANVEAVTKANFTPLYFALDYGQIDVALYIVNCTIDKIQEPEFLFQELLNKSCNIKKGCEDRKIQIRALMQRVIPDIESRLLEAVKANNTALTKALLNIGANPSLQDPRWWRATPLLWAASKGYEEVMQLLLQAGANLTERNERGITALHLAAYNGHENVCKLALKEGIPVNSKDNMGSTPLHFAAGRGHVPVTKLLLDKGAALDAKDKFGGTALHDAASSGGLSIVQLLVEKGASITERDSQNATPLDRAISNEQAEIVEWFKKMKHL